MKNANSREIEYIKIPVEEQKKRGILGRLAGIMADFKNPTRNGRFYSEKVWDKVFQDPIMQEKIKNRCLFGELEHPVPDRENIDPEKVAVCLAEEPKKYPDGTVKGVFDILDTPNGRILKTLCDYGCKVGVSSRGAGEVKENWSTGSEEVDPSTYECFTFDVVLVPGVSTSRLTPINESLEKEKSLKSTLLEMLKNSSEEDKKIMKETLEKIKFDCSPEKVNDKEEPKEENLAAIDNGAEILQGLKESIKQNKALQEQIRSLQEKLSVCNAKEAALKEENDSYKIQLEESAKDKNIIDSLTEKLSSANEMIEVRDRKIKILSENLNNQKDKTKSLNESLQRKSDLEKLNESLIKEKEEKEKQLVSINENLEEAKQDSLMIKQEYVKRLKKAESLIEHYKQVAKVASDKYINVKAHMIGVSPTAIKNKLNEGYSFKDIDSICENLQSYQLKVDSLPFNINKSNNIKVAIKESKEPMMSSRFDDEIDENLINLANKH